MRLLAASPRMDDSEETCVDKLPLPSFDGKLTFTSSALGGLVDAMAMKSDGMSWVGINSSCTGFGS